MSPSTSTGFFLFFVAQKGVRISGIPSSSSSLELEVEVLLPPFGINRHPPPKFRMEEVTSNILILILILSNKQY